MSYDVAPEGITAIFLTVCTGLFCVGCGFSHSLVGGIFLCAALTIGFFSLPGMEERLHKKKLAAEMPGIFRTLAVALGCGQTLSQAIEYVALHERGIAAHGFMRASLRLRCGMKSSEVLSLMVQEIDAPGISLLATALIISQRTGSPLRDLFQKSAMLVERQHEIERTLSVKTAQVRLSVKVVCALPVILVGVLSLISTDFQKGLVTPIGTACVLIACALDALALMIIRRLMRGVM
ncbi:MAG: type II secretion system F family protein [Atopobiaceae bacterium]